ncbi:MAG: prepilin-type N-terminal cleavage/methylation domain-containing protein [Pirellulaceae bacterium]
MKSVRSAGFTLVEVLIVVVIMAILAAVVVPQFASSTDDAKISTAEFNLSTLRSILQTYRGQHNGTLPTVDGTTNLPEQLLQKTAKSGTLDVNGAYGPYLLEFPDNPFTGNNTVVATANTTMTSGDVTANDAGGWMFNETTGQIWLDSDPGFDY